MNVVEACLKRLVEHMRKMILELLCSLKIEEHVGCFGESVELAHIEAIRSITEIIGGVLDVESHVSTDSPALIVLLHVRPHLVDGILFRFETDVQQYAELRVYRFTKAFEEKKVRR